MSNIAIITDTNSGISNAEAHELKIDIVPMPFYIDEQLYFEGISLDAAEFYDKLKSDCEIKTSQPSPADLLFIWDEKLKAHDSIVYIPMSSGLSSSCDTARMLAQDYDGRVQVVDNHRVSVTQRQSVLDAVELARAGKSAEEIKNILESVKDRSSIYITLDTLKYLKKGGRITPTAAAIGAVLNIKPVLQINGEKLDSYAKVRGLKAAKDAMIEAMKKDIAVKYNGATPETLHLAAAYTGDEADGLSWKKELEEQFPGYDIHLAPLSLSVSCHIGPGSLAIACSEFI